MLLFKNAVCSEGFCILVSELLDASVTAFKLQKNSSGSDLSFKGLMSVESR